MTMIVNSYKGEAAGAMPRVVLDKEDLHAVAEPVKVPKEGEVYQPRGQMTLPRKLGGRYQVMGVEHTTDDADLQHMYVVVHLAMRSALRWRMDNPHVARLPLRVAEIGSWCGESAVAMGIAIEDALLEAGNTSLGCAMWLVDRFTGTLCEMPENVVRMYGGSIKDLCRDNVSQLEMVGRNGTGVKFEVDLVVGDSVESATSGVVPDNLDYVFVDADHSYDGCKGDIEAWWPKLRPGAIMAGHDYGSAFPGVIVAVDECCEHLAGCRPLVIHGSTVWWVRKPEA